MKLEILEKRVKEVGVMDMKKVYEGAEKRGRKIYSLMQRKFRGEEKKEKKNKWKEMKAKEKEK